MGKRYTSEERREALKLAEEIGAAAATRRLGINADTLYGWQGREKEPTGYAAWKLPTPPWHSPAHIYPFLAFLDKAFLDNSILF